MPSRPGARAEALANARQVRKTLSPPEARLWVALRGRSLSGLKFRRQHPIGAYVLDFYCPSLRFAIEVDGLWHTSDDQAAHDGVRDRWLRRTGLYVLRIPAWAIRDELDRVTEIVERVAARLASAPLGKALAKRVSGSPTLPASGGDPHRPFGPLPP